VTDVPARLGSAVEIGVRRHGTAVRIAEPTCGGDPGDPHPVYEDTFNAHITACVENWARALGRGRVLTPDLPAARTAVAADADVQDSYPPAERDVRQSSEHAVALHPQTAAGLAPVVRLDHSTDNTEWSGHNC
jgi:hypothetical protein